VLAYVLCRSPHCGYVLMAEDLRVAPKDCPRCGNRLVTNCPRCGALFRRSSGVCVNCGHNMLPEEPNRSHQSAGGIKLPRLPRQPV